MRSGFSAALEERLQRPDSPCRLLVLPQSITKNADGSLQQSVRQKRDDWALADGAVAGPPPTLAGFDLLENGDVRLHDTTVTVLTKAGPPNAYFTDLDRTFPLFVGRIDWNGADRSDLELARVKIWLNPRRSGASSRQVVTWKLELFRLAQVTTQGNVGFGGGKTVYVLAPICDALTVPVQNDAEGLVNFDYSLSPIISRPKPKFHGTFSSPDIAPVTFLVVTALDQFGNYAGNVGIGYDSTTNSVTQSGNTLSSFQFDRPPYQGDGTFVGSAAIGNNGNSFGTPICTIESGTYANATMSFTTNPLNLGGAPAGDVQLVLRGNVPNGCALIGRIRNDADSAWVVFTDGQWMQADLGLTPSTTRKVQAELDTDASATATPTLTGLGMESFTELNLIKQTRVTGGDWAIDPQTMKGEIPEILISAIRDGDRDYYDAITDLLANNHIGDLRFRLYWGDAGLARKDWLHVDDFFIDGSHPRGAEIQLKLLSPLCFLRDLLPRYKPGSVYPPSSDTLVGAWTTDTGAAANLYQRINETIFDSTTYVRSDLTPVNSAYEFALTPPTDPVGRRLIVDYRYRKDATGGEQIDLIFQLRQGTTVIVADPLTNIDTDAAGSDTPRSFSLTDAQLATITDFTNLRGRVIANKSSGAGARRAIVSWAELRTGGKQEQVTYNTTLKATYDGLFSSELGIDGRYKGSGVEDTQSINQVAKTIFQSSGANNKPLGKAELDAIAYIAGGGIISSQGKITFRGMFGPGQSSPGSYSAPAVRFVFPSSEISLPEAGPGYEERITELFVKWKWNAAKGDFDRQEYVAHAGALLHLGKARLDPAKWVEDETCKWLSNEGLDSNGVSLAGRIGVRQVQAIGAGLMLWPFVSNYPHPHLEPGDVGILQTDKFAGRDPNVARALRGQMWVTAVIQSCGVDGRHFKAWVRNYSDMVPTPATSDRLGLGPATPHITSLAAFIDDGGASYATIQTNAATAIRYASSLSAMPSDATVRAAALTTLDASGMLTVGPLTAMFPGTTLYVKAFAYEKLDGSGLESPSASTTLTTGTRPRTFAFGPDNKYALISATNDGLQAAKESQIEGQARKLSSALTYLIPNAEMEVWESASLPHGWSVDTTAGATCAKETTAANIFSGDAAAKYSNPDNATASGWHGFATNEGAIGAFCVALRPGISYTMRIGSRSSRAGLGQQYRLRLSHNAGETITTTKAWTYKAANTYQLDIVTFTVPSTAEKNSKLYIEFNRNGDATATDFWLDSIRVDELVDRLFFDNGDVTGTVTIDWSLAPTQRIRLIGNTTLVFINGRPGNRYVLDSCQDGTGGRTLTYPANVTWAADTPPTLTSTINKMDTNAFEVVGDLVPYYRGHSVSQNVTSYDVKAAIRDIQVLSSQTAGTTIAITGLGFAPTLVLVIGSGRNDAVDAAGRASFHANFGAATGASTRRSVTMFSSDAATPSASARWGASDAIANEIDGTSRTGALDITSFDADGVTFNIRTQYVTSRRYQVVCIGGKTFRAAIGDIATPAVTGNQDITGLPFDPTGVVLFGGAVSTMGSSLAHGILGLGFGTSSSARYAICDATANAQTTQEPVSYGYTGECFADGTTGALPLMDASRLRADFVSFLSGGFRINWLETAQFLTEFYIAVAGCRCAVANLATQTDTTTDITVSGLTVLPKFGLLISHNRATSTQNANDNDAQVSIGVFGENPAGGVPVQRAVSNSEQYNASAAAVVAGAGVAYAAAYQNLAVASGAEEGKMQVTSITTGGFVARMSVADPSAARVGVFVLGH